MAINGLLLVRAFLFELVFAIFDWRNKQMLQVKQGFDSLVRLDRKLKVINPATVIDLGACCKLDSNGEVVLTGADAALEDLVFFAFSTANVPDELNSAFKATGKVTLIAPTVFEGETDQYLTSGTYGYGTALASENGLLIPAAAGDRVIARALGAPVDGMLSFITVSKGATA